MIFRFSEAHESALRIKSLRSLLLSRLVLYDQHATRAGLLKPGVDAAWRCAGSPGVHTLPWSSPYPRLPPFPPVLQLRPRASNLVPGLCWGWELISALPPLECSSSEASRRIAAS